MKIFDRIVKFLAGNSSIKNSINSNNNLSNRESENSFLNSEHTNKIDSQNIIEDTNESKSFYQYLVEEDTEWFDFFDDIDSKENRALNNPIFIYELQVNKDLYSRVLVNRGVIPKCIKNNTTETLFFDYKIDLLLEYNTIIYCEIKTVFNLNNVVSQFIFFNSNPSNKNGKAYMFLNLFIQNSNWKVIKYAHNPENSILKIETGKYLLENLTERLILIYDRGEYITFQSIKQKESYLHDTRFWGKWYDNIII